MTQTKSCTSENVCPPFIYATTDVLLLHNFQYDYAVETTINYLFVVRAALEKNCSNVIKSVL